MAFLYIFDQFLNIFLKIKKKFFFGNFQKNFQNFQKNLRYEKIFEI